MGMVLKVTAVIVGIFVVGYLAVLVFAWKYQDRMAFPGSRSALPAPQTFGIADGLRITVTASDGVELSGWYLPPHPLPAGNAPAPALVWFYGNMETIEGIAPVLRDYRPPGVALVVLDYRGYGTSQGEPTEAGVYLDAEAAWEYLASREEIDTARVGVYGRSIGSSVALYLATSHDVRAVVLDSPFSTGRDMKEEHYPLLPSSLMRLSLDNVGRAAQLESPLLIFHGTEDWIAPIEMGRSVAAAGRAVEMIEIQGAGHNDTYMVGGSEYRERFHQFLAEHLR